MLVIKHSILASYNAGHQGETKLIQSQAEVCFIVHDTCHFVRPGLNSTCRQLNSQHTHPHIATWRTGTQQYGTEKMIRTGTQETATRQTDRYSPQSTQSTSHNFEKYLTQLFQIYSVSSLYVLITFQQVKKKKKRGGGGGAQSISTDRTHHKPGIVAICSAKKKEEEIQWNYKSIHLLFTFLLLNLYSKNYSKAAFEV